MGHTERAAESRPSWNGRRRHEGIHRGRLILPLWVSAWGTGKMRKNWQPTLSLTSCRG